MDNRFAQVFQLLRAKKFEEIKRHYLLDMISFDFLKEPVKGDTLLHYFFRQDELLPVETLKFLISCFFQVDHLNNDNKTAVHILFEKHPLEINYFACIKNKGIPLFQKKGDTMSILEIIFYSDNVLIFESLIGTFNLDYIRQCYYDKFLSLAFKFESLDILSKLVQPQPYNLYTLFQEFLEEIKVPTSETSEESANFQFFSALKNSKKKLFKTIFENIDKSNNIITLDMLYYCTDASFCIYLSKYIKEGEYSKISTNENQSIPSEIFTVVNDLSLNIFKSRSIIHSAARKGLLNVIRQIPPIMYDSVNYSGNTPLYYAIKERKDDVAKYLIKHGNCDFCHLGKKTTPLHLAAKGRPAILKKMLSYVSRKKYEYVFDINVKDRDQNTPLLAPFKSKSSKDIVSECLRLLIENGADINACDLEGKNILFYAFKCYHSLNSEDFFNYILNFKELTLTEKGKMSLLKQLYSEQSVENINTFLDKFGINSDFMKKIFAKFEIPNFEKVYQLLKEKGNNNDYFFDCLKTANSKVIINMIKQIDGLLFYVNYEDNNDNILFILANSYFKSEFQLFQILITIFEAVIQNNREDFLFIQNKENGDNFLHVAIRKRNDLLIQIMLDIYQKKANKIFDHFKGNKDEIWFLINQLFYQQNNDTLKLNPIELEITLYSSFQNIFPLEIFQKEPSYNELENFLLKFRNPNIIQNKEPLIIKYVKCVYFNEDEMLKILELFNSYGCDFTQEKKDNENEKGEYAAKILIKRSFYKCLDYLLYNHGIGSNAGEIIQIYEKSKLKDDENHLKNIKNFEGYYSTFLDLNKYIHPVESLSKFILDSIRFDYHDENKYEAYWPLVPILQRFLTLNEHSTLYLESLGRILTQDSPVQKYFEILIPFFKDVYDNFFNPFRTFHEKNKSNENDKSDTTNSFGFQGCYASLITTLSGYASIIDSLIKFCFNKSIKEQLSICRDTIHEIIFQNQIYAIQFDELNEVIKNKKTDFNFSRLSSKLFQIFVEINDCSIAMIDRRLKNYYLICTDEVIVLTIVDSESVKLIYKQPLSKVFCTDDGKYNKLKIFTIDGMIEFNRIDDINKTLSSIRKMIKDNCKKMNKLFDDEWNSKKNMNDASSSLVFLYYVNSSILQVIGFSLILQYDRNADASNVREFGLKKIQSTLFNNDPEYKVLFSFSEI